MGTAIKHPVPDRVKPSFVVKCPAVHASSHRAAWRTLTVMSRDRGTLWLSRHWRTPPVSQSFWLHGSWHTQYTVDRQHSWRGQTSHVERWVVTVVMLNWSEEWGGGEEQLDVTVGPRIHVQALSASVPISSVKYQSYSTIRYDTIRW